MLQKWDKYLVLLATGYQLSADPCVGMTRYADFPLALPSGTKQTF